MSGEGAGMSVLRGIFTAVLLLTGVGAKSGSTPCAHTSAAI